MNQVPDHSSTASENARSTIPTSPEPKYSRRAFRVKELVEILGLPRSTLHDLIRRAEIHAVHLGKGRRKIVLIPVEEVDRLLVLPALSRRS
jgi:excisionase family DNA binding protein